MIKSIMYLMNSAVLIWLAAIRPKTLPLACSAIILASAIAAYDGIFDLSIFILSLTTAVLLQIVSNLANDYGDAISGADNEKRVGPLRVMQAGLVNQKDMKKALVLSVSFAIISGVSLVYLAFIDSIFWISLFILMGGGAIVAAITYTMGSKPYGYRGYGDISVFIFFGLVGVLGCYALYGKTLNVDLLLPATCCGLLCSSVLNINNLRDFYTDSQAGKHTLVVKIGTRNAIIYHWVIFFLAELSTAAYIVLNSLPLLTWLHLIPFTFLIKSSLTLSNFAMAELMNKQLKITVLSTFSYCCLFSMGLVYSI